jgi:cation transport ATPase-like protein
MTPPPFWSVPQADLLRRLDSSSDGLPGAVADQRLGEVGPNRLQDRPRAKEVDMATELRSVPINATNEPLDRRLHDIGWGLMLMLTGMIWLVPAERVPEGAWLVGVAAILLGLNAVRYVKHISVSGREVSGRRRNGTSGSGC